MASPTPPSKTPDRHYDFRAMNVVFAVSALAFLAVTLFMVMRDYGRPWKRFQSEFRDLDRQAVVADLQAERQSINEQQMATVRQEIDKANEQLAGAGKEISDLEDTIDQLDKDIFAADAKMRGTKSKLDAQKYQYDLALQSGDPGAIEDEKNTVDELTTLWQEETRVVQDLQAQQDARKKELDEKREHLSAAQKRLADLTSALNGLQTRLGTLEKNLSYYALNAPLMDFLAPDLRIEQVMLAGLYHDINFTTIDRVDRCMTCHLAANRQGYDDEQWAEPYRSHPRQDLFVADGSPHPYNRFGCTVCHSGLDRATDFARAGHSPADEEQLHHWVQEYGWEKQQFLETPIHPAGLSEAGCLACHADQVWTPESQVADRGRKLINKMGCYGCHVIDYPAFSDLAKPGPDLRKVASKTNPAWAAKWIEAPRDFRRTTWMPHFFFQENIEGEQNEAFQRAEIESVVDFLWDVSERPTYGAVPSGSAERGKALFESVGCTGCHLLDGESSREDHFDEIERLQGPNLIGVGSKVTPGWLYAWLKNPKQYRPDSAMPNLRLSNQEAADLVAFLMQQRKPEWEGLSRQTASAEARAELVKRYLQSNMTIEQSEARVDEMTDLEQSLYLGRQTISKYGCFGCHEIAGFEDRKPIGVELSDEASKPLHLFDFGHVHEVPHTKADWIRTKLMTPRVWDEGKQLVKTYDELYKMPNFGMSRREADAVLSVVLGFTKESVREERKAGDPSTQPALAAGRKLVTRYNCQGCHIIEGHGQAIRSAMPDDSNLPPNIASEGGRAQADWLFGFLHNPGEVQLRPWLKVRMPTFDFSDDEVNVILAYFQALDGTTPFESDAPRPDPRSVAIGGEIFGMLQCGRCHPAGPAALAALGGGTAELAPSLLLAKERLRYDWVPGWIKDPQTLIPGTKMPTNFPYQNGAFFSPLPMAIDQAAYSDRKRALQRHFSTEQELKQFLGDVDAVSTALRDYLWSL